MIVNDPIGDMLIQIKNAAMAKKRTIELPNSKLKLALAKTLIKAGYLTDAAVVGNAPKVQLRLTIAYEGKLPILTDLRRISKPGLRLYVGKSEIPRVVGGMGVAILSTPQGILTGGEAKKQGVGGELLCEVW